MPPGGSRLRTPGGRRDLRSEAEARRLLKDLRAEIDDIDSRLVDLLAARWRWWKRSSPSRRRRASPPSCGAGRGSGGAVCARAEGAGVPQDLVEQFWRRMIQWTVDYEEARLR